MNIDEVITVRSTAVNGTLISNEGYCIEISKISIVGWGNKLGLTCGIGSTTLTTTTTQSTEITKKITKITNALPITTKIVPTTTIIPSITTTTTIDTKKFTFTKWTSTDGSMSTRQANTQLTTKDNDDTIILAAGASVGGFVIIIVIIVIVCIYRRYHKKPTSKPVPALDNDYDAYGMRENVLYVSSQPTGTPQPQNSADCQDTNRISVDIDGNYSTVDWDEIPTVEESTGDYSSIDLEKPKPTTSIINESTNQKPIIAPKPEKKMTIQDDVYAVPDKKSAKHITSPGENGCEYAVVSKPNKSNFDKSEDQPSTSNVYAVVAKKKRMSDGKGTNQKRESLTSDRETGQSSKT
ncbi:uncharacterized protein LOC127725441 [Mytilus californianus]|uniref:uncharacterized protein LOC127725441 n=1 Tax=Mytilus californianus TaxID=6549 RepID=UPI002245FB65|nr:uncharacterized protein LOC127725441 [Mytilus californianus]